LGWCRGKACDDEAIIVFLDLDSCLRKLLSRDRKAITFFESEIFRTGNGCLSPPKCSAHRKIHDLIRDLCAIDGRIAFGWQSGESGGERTIGLGRIGE
jgi:hypothetical protein